MKGVGRVNEINHYWIKISIEQNQNTFELYFQLYSEIMLFLVKRFNHRLSVFMVAHGRQMVGQIAKL